MFTQLVESKRVLVFSTTIIYDWKWKVSEKGEGMLYPYLPTAILTFQFCTAELRSVFWSAMPNCRMFTEFHTTMVGIAFSFSFFFFFFLRWWRNLGSWFSLITGGEKRIDIRSNGILVVLFFRTNNWVLLWFLYCIHVIIIIFSFFLSVEFNKDGYCCSCQQILLRNFYFILTKKKKFKMQ